MIFDSNRSKTPNIPSSTLWNIPTIGGVRTIHSRLWAGVSIVVFISAFAFAHGVGSFKTRGSDQRKLTTYRYLQHKHVIEHLFLLPVLRHDIPNEYDTCTSHFPSTNTHAKKHPCHKQTSPHTLTLWITLSPLFIALDGGDFDQLEQLKASSIFLGSSTLFCRFLVEDSELSWSCCFWDGSPNSFRWSVSRNLFLSLIRQGCTNLASLQVNFCSFCLPSATWTFGFSFSSIPGWLSSNSVSTVFEGDIFLWFWGEPKREPWIMQVLCNLIKKNRILPSFLGLYHGLPPFSLFFWGKTPVSWTDIAHAHRAYGGSNLPVSPSRQAQPEQGSTAEIVFLFLFFFLGGGSFFFCFWSVWNIIKIHLLEERPSKLWQDKSPGFGSKSTFWPNNNLHAHVNEKL